MILRRLQLKPFAGLAEREIRFERGMNVIMGPNDVGKSTLFRAVESVLFLPVKTKANSLEGREQLRVIPLGGDHAQVELEFETSVGTYLLRKKWGESPSALLTLPGGTKLMAPERIDEELKRALPAPPGSFRTTLLVGQSQLEATVATLTKNPGCLHTLGDALRVAMNETDGVSVDRLKALLAERFDAAFLNWDRSLQAPKKGRGTENPWERQGSLLKAWYQLERSRKKLALTQALEEELGEKNQRLTESLARQSLLQKYVKENETRVNGASTRKSIELKLAQSARDTQALTLDIAAWHQREADRRVLEPEIGRLEGVVQRLADEVKAARAFQGRQAFFERFSRIEAAERELLERRQRLSETPAVSAQDLLKLRQGRSRTQAARASLSASKLEIEFTPKVALGIIVQKDLEKEIKESLPPGPPIKVRAGGKIRLSTELFDLKVTSGDGRMDQLEDELKLESSAIRQLFNALGIHSVEEAEARHERWLVATQAVSAAEAALRALLGGDRHEDLRKLFESEQTPALSRGLDLVEKEHEAAQAQLTARKTENAAALRSLQDLQRRHLAREAGELTDRLVKSGIEEETLRTQLASLPSLPDGTADLEGFISDFRKKQADLGPLADEIRALSVVVAGIEARMPEESAQDCDREAREALDAWKREQSRAQALDRISEAVSAMESEAGDIYAGFRKELEQSIERLSAGTYGQARLETSLPTGFQRRDGAMVPSDWLSSGTRDAFALALRLAMARCFLADSKGFVLLDDPMVAMDPERQAIAARLLQEFAGQSQLVVFTCHPSVASLLGGHQSAIERDPGAA